MPTSISVSSSIILCLSSLAVLLLPPDNGDLVALPDESSLHLRHPDGRDGQAVEAATLLAPQRSPERSRTIKDTRAPTGDQHQTYLCLMSVLSGSPCVNSATSGSTEMSWQRGMSPVDLSTTDSPIFTYSQLSSAKGLDAPVKETDGAGGGGTCRLLSPSYLTRQSLA